MTNRDVAILGAGMHPWGKGGTDFAHLGVVAARRALAEAGLETSQVGFLSAGLTVRNGYPGYVAAATIARSLGLSGTPITSCYAACASGSQAIDVARTRILAGLCDVAVVVGADCTPKGFLAPTAGERVGDPDWLRFRLLGATNPTYFAMYARRRMEAYGTTPEDLARVKVKNSRHGLHNVNARYRKAVTVEEVLASPMVSDPLHLLDVCATSDGGAALVLSSVDFARQHGFASAPRIAAVSTVTPTHPRTEVDLPDIATDSGASWDSSSSFGSELVRAAYAEAGLGPQDIDVAEVYDLSTAFELDWYEALGLCAPGDAEGLVRDGVTAIGGRVPVNPSGGLASFGEAVPAQAIAQVCELAWQLRGMAGDRQVAGARVGITANRGLFGHGSSVVCRN